MSEEIAQAGADLAEMIRLHAQIAELKIKTENDIVVAVFYAYARLRRTARPAGGRPWLRSSARRRRGRGSRRWRRDTARAAGGTPGPSPQIAAALLQERLAAGHSIEIRSPDYDPARAGREA